MVVGGKEIFLGVGGVFGGILRGKGHWNTVSWGKGVFSKRRTVFTAPIK